MKPTFFTSKRSNDGESRPLHRQQEEATRRNPASKLTEDLLDAYALLGNLPDIDGNPLLDSPDANHSCEIFLPLLAEVFEAKLFSMLCSTNSTQWTPTQLYDPVTYGINAASTRLFMSETLFQNEEWLQVSCDFVINSVELAEETRKFPRFVRPLAHRRLRSKDSPVMEQMQRVRALLLQAISEHKIKRFLAYGTGASVENPAPLNTAAAMNEEPHEVKQLDDKLQAKRMALSIVSIHMISLTVCQALHDLSRRPMLVIGLREEIRDVMADRNGTGVWSDSSLAQLSQLDNFLQEVRGGGPEKQAYTTEATTQRPYDFHLVMDGEADGLPDFAKLEIKVLVIMFILHFDIKAAEVEGGYRTADVSDHPAKGVLMLRRYQGRSCDADENMK